MIQVTGKVVGGEEVARRFKTKGDALRTRLRDTIEDLAEQLMSQAKSAAPVGEGRRPGGPNPRRMKKLKDSARLKSFERALSIGSTVSFKAFYARYVESGYGPAEERVRGYLRRDERSTIYKRKVNGGLSKRKEAQGIVFVRPFNRVGKAAPHPFFVPAARSMGPTVSERVSAVVDATMRE